MRTVSSLRLLFCLPASAVLASCLLGCTTDECLGNQNALPLAGFYSSSLTPKKISIDSINIYGVGAPNDSMLADTAKNLSSIYLPFNLDTGRTQYVIQYVQSAFKGLDLADTITFDYTATPRFVSSACGVSYVFDLNKISYTTLMIDSVTCPLMSIDNQDMENIQIYFRVAEEEEQ